MSGTFSIPDPSDAARFLKAFDKETKERGEACFSRRWVSGLCEVEEGKRYAATVFGTRPNLTKLEYSDGTWWGECSCLQEEDCLHVYAAMKALLAQHRAPRPSQANRSNTSRKTDADLPKPPEKAEPSLGELVAKALNRPLQRHESRFVDSLSFVHKNFQRTGSLHYWDLAPLQISLGSHATGEVRCWPEPPKSAHEFWLFLAHEIVTAGQKLPEFMAPVTDLTLIEEPIRRWNRMREIDKWKRALGQTELISLASETAGLEFRLRFAEEGLLLESRRGGSESFQVPKVAQFLQWVRQADSDELDLPPESGLIWSVFCGLAGYARRPMVDYSAVASSRSVAGLFRSEALKDRLVNSLGEPFARQTEALRWELLPAEDLEEDYRLRLVRSDGAPLGSFLCALATQPVLYVTRKELYPGPPVPVKCLDPRLESRIPAPALETKAGAQLLHALAVELPPRLRDRVTVIPLEVHFTCALTRSYPGASTEAFQIEVEARETGGRVLETYDGQRWLRRPQPGSKRSEMRKFVLQDRGLLERVPEWLASLPLKRDYYTNQLQMRVTRNFPEQFTAWVRSLPPEVKLHPKGELASLLEAPLSGRVRLDVTEREIDWFDMQVVLDISDTELSPEELKLLLNAKGSYVRLEGKGWRRLQFDLSEEEDERLARLGVSPHELTGEPQRLHALQLADEAAAKFLPPEQTERLRRRAAEIKARVTPSIPSSIKAELRPYQLEGFHFLAYLAANHFGGILADDMGLGKTLQTLTWLAWLRAEQPEGAPSPSLVVCPKSVMDNWRAEAERFLPDLRVKVWPPAELNTLTQGLSQADLHVINYSQLRNLGETLLSTQWLALILDEGQYIKNPNSQTAQVARSLRAGHRLVLSGTPIENRLLDLWSLMAFAMPGALGSRARFAQTYDSKTDPLARRRLASRVRPFLLRRTKGEVAKDLPARMEEDLYCEIEGEQMALYRAELKRAQQLLLKVTTQKQLANQQFHFLVSLLRLRQICCDPRLVKPDSKAASAKIEALMEQIEPLMEEGHKVLIFSQFVEMLGLLKEALQPKGWPLFYLSGQTENRGDLVRSFQEQKGEAAFLVSLKAGGFGLNLTAASYVVLFDPWWNPAVENQAIDRTHRIGQTRQVIAYRLLIKNSIEEKIRQLQRQKSALVQDVLGEEKFGQSLTLDDLRFLFSD